MRSEFYHGFLNRTSESCAWETSRRSSRQCSNGVCLKFDDGEFEAHVHIQRNFVEKLSFLWRDLEWSEREFSW